MSKRVKDQWALRLRLWWNSIRYRPRRGADVYRVGGGWGNHLSRVRPEDSVFVFPCRYYGHQSRHPKVGDRVAQPMESGNTLTGTVVEAKRCSNPRDMFFVSVQWTSYDIAPAEAADE